MMRRNPKPRPVITVNGWAIEPRPRTFAERFAYEATAFDAAGFLTARRGFQTLRDATAFCAANHAPRERAQHDPRLGDQGQERAHG